MRLECEWVMGVPQASVPALSLFPGEYVPPTQAVAVDPETAVGEPIAQVSVRAPQSPLFAESPRVPQSAAADEAAAAADDDLLKEPTAEQLGMKRRSVSFADADALEQVMPIITLAAPNEKLELAADGARWSFAGGLAVPPPPDAFDVRLAEGFTISALALDQSSCLVKSAHTKHLTFIIALYST